MRLKDKTDSIDRQSSCRCEQRKVVQRILSLMISLLFVRMISKTLHNVYLGKE